MPANSPTPTKDINAQLLENCKIGVWSIQSVESGVMCNHALRDLLSLSSTSDLISWEQFLTYIHPDYQELFTQNILHANHTRFEFDFRPFIIKSDIHWLQCVGTVTFDNSQTIIQAQGIVQNISHTKSLENQLEHFKSLNKDYHQSPNFGSWRTDFKTNTVYWSDSVYEMFGIDKNELVLTRELFIELIHPEDRESVKQAFVNAVMQRSRYSIDHRILLPNGKIRWLRENADVVYNDLKELVEMIGTVQDITVLKEKDKRIELSEAFYSSLVENLPQCIFRKDIDGVFTFVDSNFCRLLDKSYDEIVGNTDFDLYPQDLAQKYQQDDLNVIQNGEILQTKEQNILPDGTTMTVQVIKSPVFDSLGNVIAIQGIFWDVTETTRLEEQLRQAQKMEAVGQLAGGIAHDFNNIIVVINLNCELALSRVEPNTELHSEILEIQDASSRAASLTRQMLAFSRKQVLNTSIIDINQLLFNLEKMLKRIIGEDIRFQTSFASGIPNVFADPAQIEQVIMNLIVNARDAMPTGGELIIGTRQENITTQHHLDETRIEPGLYVIITVKDSGTGMEKEQLPKIFEPFFTTKKRGKGTGLGLSTVYGIVKQSGGYIDVKSELNHGTEFNLYFPAYDGSEKPVEMKAEDTFQSVTSANILLVEDDSAVRESLIRLFRKRNYNVVAAADGLEALELLQTNMEPVDLLITDLIMPGMNGVELSKKISELHPGIRTLYISGYSGNLLEQYDLKVDEVNFLHKPFLPEKLMQTVKNILSS